MDATITIAPAIEVPTERQRKADGDPLMQKIEAELLRMMAEKSEAPAPPQRIPATSSVSPQGAIHAPTPRRTAE